MKNFIIIFAKKKEMSQEIINGTYFLVTKLELFNNYLNYNLKYNKFLNIISTFLKFNSKCSKKKNINFYNKQNKYICKLNTNIFLSPFLLLNIFSKKKDIFFDFLYRNKINIKILDFIKTIDLIGESIGKGFSGTIKKYNFKRGPMSHGSKNHRLPGSIGASTTPGRVLRRKKMAGHLGSKQVTIKNVIIKKKEANNIFIKGSVPGKINSLIKLRLWI